MSDITASTWQSGTGSTTEGTRASTAGERAVRPSVDGVLNDVLLVVPTLNEEEGLPCVLDEARGLGVATLVRDGGSSDRTREVAAGYGVPVIGVSKGKARGWREFLH